MAVSISTARFLHKDVRRYQMREQSGIVGGSEHRMGDYCSRWRCSSSFKYL